MEEGSGKVQNASTHGSLIVMYLAAVEIQGEGAARVFNIQASTPISLIMVDTAAVYRHVAAFDNDSSTLHFRGPSRLPAD